MTYRILDLETTGFPVEGEASGIMEVGICDMRFDIIKQPMSFLVDCGIPVSIGARATHHISDEMVAGEIKPDEACKIIADGEHEYLCAHNVDHEKAYVAPGVRQSDNLDRKWICTYKTALRIWPESPGHKLQELRYQLQLDASEDFDPKLADPPHRAGADAYVCAHLLRKILKEITIEQAVRWSNGPALLYMCFLKKHKGTPWKDVPKDYLSWVVDNVTDRDIRATAKYYLNHSQRI